MFSLTAISIQMFLLNAIVWIILFIPAFVLVTLVLAPVLGFAVEALRALGVLPQPRIRAYRGRPPIPAALRKAVLDRDGWACVECGSKENLQMDHEVPISRGGATNCENLRVLCQSCNEKKGAR